MPATDLDPDPDDGMKTLLLDRRLARSKGRQITSFASGTVATFLALTPLFLDSTVLSGAPPDTLALFISLVLGAVPALTAGRRCRLLFRSSVHGATAAAFHSRCDAQGPTLTLIRDKKRNVFGGYAAVQWSSPAADAGEDGDGYVCLNDPAAFLFTVVNPHADPPALFSSKANGYSIGCQSSEGPWFCGDLYVSGAFGGYCYTDIDYGYTNGTRHYGHTVLTGALYFTPAEVEVWGFIDD